MEGGGEWEGLSRVEDKKAQELAKKSDWYTEKKIWGDKCVFFYEKLIYTKSLIPGRRQLRIHKSYINEILILCEVKNAGEETDMGTCFSWKSNMESENMS